MIAYVESNFVLELALQQEQHRSCAQILDLAAEEQLRLVVPAFSLTEPYDTLTRSLKKRQAVAEELRKEVRQLARSAQYGGHTAEFDALTSLLVSSQEEEKGRLSDILQQIIDVAEVISLTAGIIFSSLHHQRHRGFSPQDSIVYSSVVAHLTPGPIGQKVFLNRNSKDFDDPDVEDELSRSGCKILFSFDDGINYVLHQLELRS